MVIDISDVLELEESSISKFVASGCTCKHFDGGPCCKLFSTSHYREVRDQCRELTRSELDLVTAPRSHSLWRGDTGQEAQAQGTQKVFHLLLPRWAEDLHQDLLLPSHHRAVQVQVNQGQL